MSQNRINNIAIQNFKFIAQEQIISIEGKNLLLYGENGSGKSSIYWAIYTLLEAANKENINEIRKYFDSSNEEQLLNINFDQNLSDTPTSFIKIDFVGNNDEFKVSFLDPSINQNSLAKESNLSSDFINYRHLLNLYNFAHSEEINLFNFFRYEILPYLKFSPLNIYKNGRIISTQSGIDIINYVLNGPPKIEEDTENYIAIYPTKISNRNFHDTFKNVVRQTVSQLEGLITYINTEGNPILKEDLKYDITFKLTVKYSKEYKISKHHFDKPEFKILLNLPEFEGKIDKVKKPHSFLNEAKLTAVALAIRLAILKRTLTDSSSDSLKLLVLDDLMISLDMSNRERILELILNKYVLQYQVFIFTHDRSLFYDTLLHLKQHYKELAVSEGKTTDDEINNYLNDKWLFLEMFQAVNQRGFNIPFITKHRTPIQKAYYYFKEEVDFKACANNLRSALESFFREDFLPPQFFKDEYGNPLRTESLTLGTLLEKAKEYYNTIGFNKSPLIKLERYISRSLNPSSHFNPKSNYYRKELEDVFEIYQTLKKNTNKPLINVGEHLTFEVNTTDNTKYTYEVELLDDIRIYNENNRNNPYCLSTDKRSYGLISIKINNEEPKVLSSDNTLNSKTLVELYEITIEKIKSHMHKEPIIETEMFNVFRHNGLSIQEKIENNYLV